MKFTQDIDLKIGIVISLTGLLITCYLWTFVNAGNHWELFGTDTERFLMGYGGDLLMLLPTVSLVVPLLLKRDKKRGIIALFSIPVFIFLWCSLIKFLD